MKAKVVVCLLGFASLFAAEVRGQEYSKFDLFAGYSYVRANPGVSPTLPSFNMNGGEASLAYNSNSWLSGVVDFAGYSTSRLLDTEPASFKSDMFTYLFGPRLSYRRLGRFTPFAQTLFGIAHTGPFPGAYVDGKQTYFAMTLGGGVDYRLSRRFSVRVLQADYLLTHFKEFDSLGPTLKGTQNNVRLSTGLAFHF
jgi:opacity protein-like surface antigen